MGINDAYEEQTRRLLADTMTEVETLKAEIQERQKRLSILEAEASAYDIALQGYFRRTGRQVASEIDWGTLLQGQTHKEQIVTVAKQKGGRVTVGEVTDLLYSKGFIKTRKRTIAYSIVQRLLTDMVEGGTFLKLGPGEYKLIGAQETLPLKV